MKSRAHTVFGLLLVLGLLTSCAEAERVSASCDLAPIVTFDGLQYIAVGSLPGLKGVEVELGKGLGAGEPASCPGDPKERVQVFKVVGVPVGRAVFAKPVYGLMKRWNRDGTIK